MKKFTCVFMILAMAFLKLAAQDCGPVNSYIFKFVGGNNMFYVPYAGNETSLEDLISMIKANEQLLKDGERYIHVASYATSPNEQENVSEVSYIRRNRVKSELIIKGVAIEDFFATSYNDSSPYGPDALKNVVVVTIPASIQEVREIRGNDRADVVQAYCEGLMEEVVDDADQILAQEEAERLALEARMAEEARIAAEILLAEEAARQQAMLEEESTVVVVEEYTKTGWNLRTNLLYWIGGFINAGVEYQMPGSSYGWLVNGGYSPFALGDFKNRLGGWFVAPEIRRYMGARGRGFLAVQGMIGGIDYKLKRNEFGRDGNMYGVGLNGGYRWYINELLDMDFTLGAGYVRFNYDTYKTNADNKKVYDHTCTKDVKKNKFFPIQAGVSLIFKF